LEEILKNKIHIDTTFRIGDGWFVEHPDSYEVDINEPLRKANGTLGLLVGDVVSVVVVLQSIGVVDWVIGKGYDQLWSYLKGLSKEFPWSPIQRSCNIDIKDEEGNLRVGVELAGFDIETISQAQVEVKSEVERLSSGDVKETFSAKITIRNDRISIGP
jgi:hypothetical protein